MNETMPRPIDAPLLYDGTDPEETRWDRDERYPDVILLSVTDGGRTKVTAERRGDSWWVCNWYVTPNIGPYWVVLNGHPYPVSVCERLADISRGAA